MSLIAVTGDPVVTNHRCTATTTCLTSLPNVLVNGEPVHYVGGTTKYHTYTGDKCKIGHAAPLAVNKTQVLVYPGGVPTQIARMGDSYTGCGVIGTPKTNVTVFAY